MEAMRRYEPRLARLEEFARWLVRRREEKRTEPERIKKWLKWLQEQRQAAAPAAPIPAPVSSRGQGPRDPYENGKIPRSGRQASLAPARDDTSGARDGTAIGATAATHLLLAPPPPPPPPPPPRPAVEFIQERAGMSIAIDTATGQMASSAQVMAALAQMPKREEES